MRGGSNRLRFIPCIVPVTVLVALVLPASAFGVLRFATPGGHSTTSNCTSPVAIDPNGPCTILRAVEDVAQNDDQVLVGTGTYDLGSQTLDVDGPAARLDIFGAPGSPPPKVTSSGGLPTLRVAGFTGSTIRDLEIESTSATGSAITASSIFPGGATMRRLVATVSSNATFGCSLTSVVMTDSVCRNTASGGIALGINSGSSGDTVLRNVTLVASNSGTGLGLTANSGAQITYEIRNSIISGTTDDIRAEQQDTAQLDIDLANSNFGDVTTVGGATVTDPNAAGNQNSATAPPVFVNVGTGDLHQAPTSPTIDTGDPTVSMLGTVDLDGAPRSVDGDCDGVAAPDIGADEFTADGDSDGATDNCDGCPAGASAGADTDFDGCKDAGEDADDDNDGVADSADNCPLTPNAGQDDADADGLGDGCDASFDPPQANDTASPDTTITDGPSGKTKKKSATISFNGSDARAVASFECKLDFGSFEPCTSPKTYSGLKKGTHTFSVRAVDAAGNVDPAPATRTWKVKKKKKRD